MMPFSYDAFAATDREMPAVTRRREAPRQCNAGFSARLDSSADGPTISMIA